MVINSTTGLIEWTPGATGDYPVSVQTTNTVGSDTQTFTVNVSESGVVKLWLEAESGSLYTPMVMASNAQASSGKYIWVPQGQGNVLNSSKPGGYAQYNFSLPQGGNYVVWGRVISNSTSDDSFFVSMDGGAYTAWETQLGGTETWVWDLVNQKNGIDPIVYSLGGGQHTLIIKQREDGTKIDRILITNDMQYVPQGQGE